MYIRITTDDLIGSNADLPIRERDNSPAVFIVRLRKNPRFGPASNFNIGVQARNGSATGAKEGMRPNRPNTHESKGGPRVIKFSEASTNAMACFPYNSEGFNIHSPRECVSFAIPTH